MIWDIYDGPRSGIANYNSEPCYFYCRLDPAGGYSDEFELSLISDELLQLAHEQWKIYRTWEMQYHKGEVSLETHPGNIGTNERYDELDIQIKAGIGKLQKYRCLFTASFQAIPNKDQLPEGVLRDLQVEWQVYSPNKRVN